MMRKLGPKRVVKLVLIPLYALVFPVVRRLPRTDRIWAFGRQPGLGDGPLALLLHARQQDPDRTYVWLAGGPDDLRRGAAHDILVVPKRSLRGLWFTLRAAVVVVTHGLGDVNRLGTPGAYIVQLWHGSPLKRIGLDTRMTAQLPSGLRNKLGDWAYGRVQRRVNAGWSMVVASSDLTARRLASAFGLAPDRVVVTGDPRTDALLTETSPAPETREVLYAPTWRDGQGDPAVPSSGDWARLRALLLEHQARLVIRSHPHGSGDYSGYRQHPDWETWVRISEPGREPDVMTLLACTDVLITDYSAVAMDYSLTERPIVFFAPDLQEFSRTRGLYEDYLEFTGGLAVTSWEGVTEQLAAIFAKDSPGTLDLVRALKQRYHAFADGRNTERVYQRIVNRA